MLKTLIPSCEGGDPVFTSCRDRLRETCQTRVYSGAEYFVSQSRVVCLDASCKINFNLIAEVAMVFDIEQNVVLSNVA